MDNGRVLVQGRHTELMSRNEQYASLIHTFLQDKNQTEEEQELQTTSDRK